MNERFMDLREKFRQIINKKRNLKDRRSRSFIDFNNNYIQQETENNEIMNLTKNSFYIKEDNNKKGAILNKKFNILKNTLDKLQIILENNINTEVKETNDIINGINNIKSHYINELMNEKISICDNLQMIKRGFTEEIKKSELNNIKTEANYLINDCKDELNKQENKINNFSHNQQNYFNGINHDIYKNIEELNVKSNNDINYSNQKYNSILNDFSSLNNKIRLLDEEEKINREKFRKDINYILNSEIENLKNNNELSNSIELIRSRKK